MKYAMDSEIEAIKKVVPVSPRMQEIKTALDEIEEIKRQILLTEYNEGMPFVIKTRKVAAMRESLFLTEHLALKLMQQEIVGDDQ